MIEKIAVIGAGTMGHGIAQVSAAIGCDVVLIDTTDQLVERGLTRMRENLDEAISRGKLAEHEREATLNRVSTATDATAAVDP